MEELFFAGLIGSVQIDSIIPYILRMETAEYSSQMGCGAGLSMDVHNNAAGDIMNAESDGDDLGRDAGSYQHVEDSGQDTGDTEGADDTDLLTPIAHPQLVISAEPQESRSSPEPGEVPVVWCRDFIAD